MEDRQFFLIYIPALEQALLNDDVSYDMNILGPDWYIDNEESRKLIYLFEEQNFERFKSFFENVAFYFDAKSHGFTEINGIKLDDFKKNLNKQIHDYRIKYISK